MTKSWATYPGPPPERRVARLKATVHELERALGDVEREVEKWSTAAATLRELIAQRRAEGGPTSEGEQS